MDTIYALATARGRAGIAVIRLSGPLAHSAVGQIVTPLPPMRVAALRALKWDGDLIDEGVVLLFEAGASFTGEDVAELQIHGSGATVQAVLRCLSVIPGLRLAQAGEFTRRALDNGRLDLTQVEGLADLIDAETEAQRRQAVRVLAGSIGRVAERWRSGMVRALALIASSIDFSDEDIPASVLVDLDRILEATLQEMRAELGRFSASERIRDGFEVAILGSPNAGKSTLLNYLAGRDVAITSEIAGTTRDVIEVRMDVAGLPVTLLDTAGLRVIDDRLEDLGIRRGLERAAGADLRIILLDENGLPPLVIPATGDILVEGKCDVRAGLDFGVSGVTGAGVDQLLSAVHDALADGFGSAGVLTRERHRIAVSAASEALVMARSQLAASVVQVEVIADSIQAAARALDVLIGRIDVETMLGEVFSSFCIGK